MGIVVGHVYHWLGLAYPSPNPNPNPNPNQVGHVYYYCEDVFPYTPAGRG